MNRNRDVHSFRPRLLAVFLVLLCEPGLICQDLFSLGRTMRADVTSIRVEIGHRDKRESSWAGEFEFENAELVAVQLLAPGFGDSVNERRFSIKNRKVVAGKNRVISQNGLLLHCRAKEQAALTLRMKDKERTFPLASIQFDEPTRFLRGAVHLTRVHTPYQLTQTEEEDHCPATTTTADGRVWLAFVRHTSKGAPFWGPLLEAPETLAAFQPQTGGDQLLVRVFDGEAWSRDWAVTSPAAILGEPRLELDAEGRPVLVWSQQIDGDWDLYAARFLPEEERWSAPRCIFADSGVDRDVALTRSAAGEVFVAWQRFDQHFYEIRFGRLDEDSVGSLRAITRAANLWAPALAADSNGNVFLAFDSYERGNYDLEVARIHETQKPQEPAHWLPFPESPKFEARPSLLCDQNDRLWLAWEQRPARWGKDRLGLAEAGSGAALFADGATIQVAVFENDRWQVPAKGIFADPTEQEYNALPELTLDGDGHVWLLYRHLGSRIGPIGTSFESRAISFVGDRFSRPRPLQRSHYLLRNPGSATAFPGGRLFLAYTTDERVQFASISTQINGQLFASVLEADPVATERWADYVPATKPKEHARSPGAVQENEDVSRLRQFRLRVDERGYQILRGEFHRHTDISLDGGDDGNLDDLWRYAMDAAQLDWLAASDHDAGGGREMPWWLTQKSTEQQHHPPKFLSLFAYERSVPFPLGHRNVLFAKPGIRPLPRMIQPNQNGRALNNADTKLLYRYLAAFDGLCAAHTSADQEMGTLWPLHDQRLEPIVELYQGCRYNYEHAGAPRSPPAEAKDGELPVAQGFVWEALQKGYRLGFAACSDHTSTHVSYTAVYAESATREGILAALHKRHCYAATDNILLVVTCGNHLMGDEFEAEAMPPIRVQAHGTAPIQKVEIIKNYQVVQTMKPETETLTTEWQDPEPSQEAVIYVRLQQQDGELAWSSPLWIRVADPESD